MNKELNNTVENTTAGEIVTVDSQSGEIVSIADLGNVASISALENPTTNFFCSIVDDGTRKSKADIYNALSGEGKPLVDLVGETLAIVDVVAHEIVLHDEDKGDIHTVRVVLVDKDGNTYNAVSEGVMSSLQKIFAIVGNPSWKDDPLLIKPRLVTTRNKVNKVLTLELAY